MIPEQIVGMIENVGHFVLVTHVRPDGDALGSLFGLSEILKSLDKKVFCFIEEPITPIWKFLPGWEKASNDLSAFKRFVADADDDIAMISLDCGSAGRLGQYKDEFLATGPFLVIDHHIAHKKYGDVL